MKNARFVRVNVQLTVALALVVGLGESFSQGIGDESEGCKVQITVVEEGKPILESRKPYRYFDSVSVLAQGKSLGLAIYIANWGELESFDVLVDGAGVRLESGGGVSALTVKTGETGRLDVAVTGNSLAEACTWGKRTLRVMVRPRWGSGEIICGQLIKKFLCPRD
jgi:hypothetical protein